MKRQPKKCLQSAAEARGDDGQLSLLLPMKFTFQLLVHGLLSLAAAMSGLHTPSPSPRQDACLWPSLNSIRFRKHPAKLGTVSAMEMPPGKAGRQQTPESGMDDF